MQKKTRSLLEELDSMYVERDRRLIIESRADNIIASAIRLVEQIEKEFGAEQAEIIRKKTYKEKKRPVDPTALKKFK